MPGRYHQSGTHPRYGGGNQGGGSGGGGGNADSHSHSRGGSGGGSGGVNPSSSSSSSSSSHGNSGGGGGGASGGGNVVLTPESLSLARLRQSAVNHPAQIVRLALYVPPRAVGAVIGRGGRTVLSVQREATRRSGGHAGPVRVSVLGGGGGGGRNHLKQKVLRRF